MQAAIDQILTPRCNSCGDSDSVAPSMHSYRGPYFCIHCCNYLDKYGRLVSD